MTRKDVISGFVTPIIMITSTMSYAAMIFSGPLASGLPVGVGFGLLGAGVVAIVYAAFSGIPFAIAGPESKPAAVLSILAAAMAADFASRGHAAEAPASVMVALIAGTLITGAALLLLGLAKAGKWIRYVPYPVVAGFTAATGWMLAAGGTRFVTGKSISPGLLEQLERGQHLHQFAATLAFVCALFLAKSVKPPLVLPAALIGGTMATHLALHVAGYSLDAARRSGWLLDISSGTALPGLWLLKSWPHISLAASLWGSGGYLALVLVTGVTLLMTVMAVEIATHVDADLDRELRLNGVANILAGLGGGMVGTVSLSRTMLNHRNGGRGRASGMITGLVCLVALAFGRTALSLTPVPILAAFLLQRGIAILIETLGYGLRKMRRTEYLQMLLIFGVIVWWDLAAGVAVGFIVACIALAINTSQLGLLKLGLSRSAYSGSVDRPPYQQEQLVRRGDSIRIMWLHGYLFFGSAHRLLLQVREAFDENAQVAPPNTAERAVTPVSGVDSCAGNRQGNSSRSLILDFRQVLGMEASAVMSLIKIRQVTDRGGYRLMLSGVSPQVEGLLRAGGMFDQTGGSACLVYPDADSALESCEDDLLSSIASRDDDPQSTDEWLTREIGGEQLHARLLAYLKLSEYQPGEILMRQGEAADGLYLIHSGRATVQFHNAEGADLRLRSMVGHTIVGEMGLYRILPRGATVRADRYTLAYWLSKDAMARMEREDPSLAHAFNKFVIRTLATRLDSANRAVAGFRS
jgi:SulP family sulfate permease